MTDTKKEDKKPLFTKDDARRLKMIELTEPTFETMETNKLYQILSNKYRNNGTMSVLCYSLKRLFKNMGEDKKAQFWEDKGGEYVKKNYEEETENKLTNNEKKNWKTQDQILKIMNSIDLKTQTDRNRFLILAMTTHQPPLRKSFYRTLRFIFNEKDIKDEGNYLLLKKLPMKSYYIVNEDKVSKWEKFKKDDNKYIEIDDKKLINLLWKSYELDPREFVFETEKGEPYTDNAFSKVLLEIPFNLNFNILRSSYVTAFYKDPDNQSMKAKMNLAQKMRHSVGVQMLNYAKDV
jgi:hypothetical protein